MTVLRVLRERATSDTLLAMSNAPNDMRMLRLTMDLAEVAELVDVVLQRAASQKLSFGLVLWADDDDIQFAGNVSRQDAIRHMDDLRTAWLEGIPYSDG